MSKDGLPANPYQPVKRPGLTLSDEKKAAEGDSGAGSGGPEVERPWGVPPGSQPDPSAPSAVSARCLHCAGSSWRIIALLAPQRGLPP